MEHRLPVEWHRHQLGLVWESAVLGLGARDTAGLPHCQQLSCPLTGCVGGEVTLGQDSSASTQVVSVTVPCEPQLSFSQKEDSIVVGTSAGATYQFQLLPVKAGGQEKRWVRTKPFQHHTHDVRAVVHTPTALISGGVGCEGELNGWCPPLQQLLV